MNGKREQPYNTKPKTIVKNPIFQLLKKFKILK